MVGQTPPGLGSRLLQPTFRQRSKHSSNRSLPHADNTRDPRDPSTIPIPWHRLGGNAGCSPRGHTDTLETTNQPTTNYSKRDPMGGASSPPKQPRLTITTTNYSKRYPMGGASSPPKLPGRTTRSIYAERHSLGRTGALPKLPGLPWHPDARASPKPLPESPPA